MKIPKTTKSYLKMLIQIAEHNANIENSTNEERKEIRQCIGHVQNELGDELKILLQKYNLKYKG